LVKPCCRFGLFVLSSVVVPWPPTPSERDLPYCACHRAHRRHQRLRNPPSTRPPSPARILRQRVRGPARCSRCLVGYGPRLPGDAPFFLVGPFCLFSRVLVLVRCRRLRKGRGTSSVWRDTGDWAFGAFFLLGVAPPSALLLHSSCPFSLFRSWAPGLASLPSLFLSPPRGGFHLSRPASSSATLLLAACSPLSSVLTRRHCPPLPPYLVSSLAPRSARHSCFPLFRPWPRPSRASGHVFTCLPSCRVTRGLVTDGRFGSHVLVPRLFLGLFPGLVPSGGPAPSAQFPPRRPVPLSTSHPPWPLGGG